MPIEFEPAAVLHQPPQNLTLWEDAEIGNVYLLVFSDYSNVWTAVSLTTPGGIWRIPQTTAIGAVKGLTPYNGTVTISN